MPDNPRIEELRRRVQMDPASIAFAQLAEEYRRDGSYQEAVAVCRTGLATHPSYLSARVTLGRALIELNDLPAAETELRYVLQHASENLAATRGMAEIYHRRGDLTQALRYYKAALALARFDPDLEQTVEDIARTVEPSKPVVATGMSFEQVSAEFLSAFGPPPVVAREPEAPAAMPQAVVVEMPKAVPPPAPPRVPALHDLERFLDRIHTYRQKRAV